LQTYIFSYTKNEMMANLNCLFIYFTFRPKPYLFKGDHKFPSANPDAPVVILYAELGTKEFSRFHQLMLAKANKGLITYVLRHFLSVRIKTFNTLK